MKGILLDNNGDLLIEGSLQIGNVKEQTAIFLFEAMRGEFREYPLLGLEAKRLLGASCDPFFITKAKKMLQHCHIEVNKIRMENNQIIIQ